jgi:hypothetical protein
MFVFSVFITTLELNDSFSNSESTNGGTWSIGIDLVSVLSMNHTREKKKKESESAQHLLFFCKINLILFLILTPLQKPQISHKF